MPGRVKVRILNARDLPVMDRASELTDAFVEVRFGTETFKTDVCKKSLNPQWNSEWFRFEVDDEVLQDEPLDLRVLDYDTYSAHDTIGKVYIDLNPLLTPESPNIISGWFPIYDTMEGLRGELNVQVCVELFNDLNKFRQSSCGIHFFCTSAVPTGWCIQKILGFIEELVVNDNPEYQWIEKIRSPRASNEARQRLFSKLSGTLQRKLGVKVIDMGGNAVLGYFQNFDLEGESGIVVRAVGTAVTLTRPQLTQVSPSVSSLTSTSPVRDIRRHTFSIHHHYSHKHDKPIPHHSTLKKHSSSPDSPPSSSHPTSARTRLFDQRRLTTDFKHQPPSAPAMIHQNKNGSNPSLFNFPYSTSLPDDYVLTPSTAPVLDVHQRQQDNPLSGLSTSTTTAIIKPITASLLPQKISLRHSVSPLRTIPVTKTNRRLSDSEIGSPPKANYMQAPTISSGVPLIPLARPYQFRSAVLQQNIELLEYPFFTMRTFPAGFIQSLGGVVSARSVKLLDKIHNPEEPETRDAWWREVRTEIKSHAAKLVCHAVLGYMEQTTICDEVIILSAIGTAAKINLNFDLMNAHLISSPPFHVMEPLEKHVRREDKKEGTKEKRLFVDINLANQAQMKSLVPVQSHDDYQTRRCSLCHIPYSITSMPFKIQLSKCAICRKKSVPEVLFTTVDPPPDMPIWSRGSLIQARICRIKSKIKNSEQSAREISDSLPFLEYEIHNQLINKLKMRGLNCLFGLRIQICIGENMLVVVATATGVYVGALPIPPLPTISTEVATAEESQDLISLQIRMTKAAQLHREKLDRDIQDYQNENNTRCVYTDEDTDENILLESVTDKNTFVLVVDDLKDDTVAMILNDIIPPEGFEICNTQIPPGGLMTEHIANNLQFQMFTQVVAARHQPLLNSHLDFSDLFNVVLRRLFFKLRDLAPCSLMNVCFNVDLPGEDEVNIAVTGCCLGFKDVPQPASSAPSNVVRLISQTADTAKPTVADTSSTAFINQTEDMMFPLEELTDHTQLGRSRLSSGASQLSRSAKPMKDIGNQRVFPALGIQLTPLNKIFNGRIDKYLGYYNFFFIRESTAMKEYDGVGGFMQNFLVEVMAIVRAHVAALGGNALVAYDMSQYILEYNQNKNQGQCLINVSGDVVAVLYDHDDDDDVGKDTFLDTPAMISSSAL